MQYFGIKDIQNCLSIPRPTIVKRINALNITPKAKIKCRSRIRYYYSFDDLNVLKDYFTSENYVPVKKAINSLIKCYEIDEDKKCTIVIHSRINFDNL